MKPLILICALMAVPASAKAETYPSRPVRIIVPTAPAGGVDLIARLIGQQLGERLGNQFFVDNRPGAGGVIGTRVAATADPDGYTLLAAPSGLAILAAIKKKLPYDVLRDLTPVALLADTPYALEVTENLYRTKGRKYISAHAAEAILVFAAQKYRDIEKPDVGLQDYYAQMHASAATEHAMRFFVPFGNPHGAKDEVSQDAGALGNDAGFLRRRMKAFARHWGN